MIGESGLIRGSFIGNEPMAILALPQSVVPFPLLFALQRVPPSLLLTLLAVPLSLTLPLSILPTGGPRLGYEDG
jgi:hypothetical protein